MVQYSGQKHNVSAIAQNYAIIVVTIIAVAIIVVVIVVVVVVVANFSLENV